MLSIWTLHMSNSNFKDQIESGEYGWFCSRLFNHVYSDTNGRWRPCCSANQLNNGASIHTHTPMEYFMSDEMNGYREMSLRGEVPPPCIRCKDREDNGVLSPRQTSNKFECAKDLQTIVNNFLETGQLKLQGRVLDLKLRIYGNYCNLKCFMCHPQNSSSRIVELKRMSGQYNYDFLARFGDMPEGPSVEKTSKFDEMLDEIENIVDHIRSVEIIGGEPFMMNSHYECLNRLIETGQSRHVEILYVSNLTKLKHQQHNFRDYIGFFKRIKVSVSMDGIKDQAEWIRYGLNWEEFLNNLTILRTYDNVDIGLNFTSSLLSIMQVVETYDYFKQTQCIEMQLSNIVTTPDLLHPKHLPDDIKQSLIDKMENRSDKETFISLVNALKMERSEKSFQLALKYIKFLNDHRKTNIEELFPDLEPYFAKTDLSLD
jgi:hypothetical protein